MPSFYDMTAKEVLEAIATLPSEEWTKIQSGLAEMIASRLSEEESSEVARALNQSEAEFEAGKGGGIEEVRQRLGLK